jgi:cell division protein FtsQ
MRQLTGKRNKILTYLSFLVILSTTSVKFSEQQQKYSLKIDKIKVTGLSDDKNLKIQNDLSKIFYKNIVVLGKDEINEVIKKYNIIEEYKVEKIYPSTLNVEIVPTKFIAKLSDDNQLIVGSNGKLISNEQSEKRLPYIFGKFNSKDFLRFKENIEKSKFDFDEFKTIYFFPSNRWDILTINDILIKLPQNNVLGSINMAYKIINNSQFNSKNIIDLRIKNHLVIK